MTPRERWEQTERKILSPYAQLSCETKGRLRPEAPCDVRTDYQRDRDRIIHSKSFRRLKHKTQVFITPEGDHYRTRLTHTLEVSQIARTIARALSLNEDLTEAIASGHDLGHTPFGHSGEAALRAICPHGFAHYEQSLRVVDVLENGKGLNLTFEVRDGILNHTGKDKPSTLEGMVVKFADRIAYINHDIDDALRGEVIKERDIPADLLETLGHSHSERINTMICALVEESAGKDHVSMQPTIYEATMRLREFMFQNVYEDSLAKREEKKAQNVLTSLYEWFRKHPDKLPEEYKEFLQTNDLDRVICDYIAGMTDSFALYLYQEIYIPKSWKHF
jgi:dGTPase